MKQTILIVDDETSFLDILQIVLQRAGYHTIVTTNGKEGLKLIHQHKPDLVVLDDMLPGISGADICMTLKSDASMSHIPVILYSAGPRVREREFIRQIGATAAISKPFKPKEVVQMIAGFLPPAPAMAVAV
ncbi:MAG: response regulator [Anaerolineae bacterium]|nr:response regulator [Anaerolineae bacterium]